MFISEQLAKGFNAQVSHELHNMMAYRCMADWCERNGLVNIAKLFKAQADDEKSHAEKFMGYLDEANAPLEVPQIESATSEYKDCLDLAQSRLELEGKTTDEINSLMDIAMQENDYGAQDFLQPMCHEQVLEMTESERFIAALEAAGSAFLLDVSLK